MVATNHIEHTLKLQESIRKLNWRALLELSETPEMRYTLGLLNMQCSN